MKKLPISICMIACAEANRIGRALESVAPWAAEIIVVLNEGVSDGTDEIARKYGAKVFFEPWKGFVIQKNSVAAKAAQPWLLNLDADEIVTPELAKEIAEVVTASSPSHDVYEFPRCTLYCGRWIRHGDWYPDRVRRLWRQDASRWIGVDPHAALELNKPPGRLRGDLLHHTSESINQQVAKTVKYADDFAKHAAEKNKRVGMFDLAVRPVWRFVRAYFLKLGFLDGWQGFSIAWMTSFYTFLRYVRVREDQVNKTPP